MKNTLTFAWCIIFTATFGLSAVADVPFHDSTFDDTNWVPTTILIGAGGSASSLQTNFAANDLLQLTVSNRNGPSGVAAYYHNSTFTYNPATDGAITALDYLVQLMAITNLNNFQGAFASPAVRQNNTNYAAIPFSTPNTVLTPFSAYALTAGNFGAVSGASGTIVVNNGRHPDFSSSGAPLTFGYMSILNTPPGSSANSATFGLDEVLIYVHTVRQPPALGLQTIAGVVVTGITNHTYLVEYTPTVGPQNWQTLTNILLNVSPLTVFDYQSGSAAQRFYRATDVTP